MAAALLLFVGRVGGNWFYAYIKFLYPFSVWKCFSLLPILLNNGGVIVFMMQTFQTEELSRWERYKEKIWTGLIEWQGRRGQDKANMFSKVSDSCHSAVFKRIVSPILPNNWQRLSVIFYELIPKSVKTKFMCSLMWLGETWRGDAEVQEELEGGRNCFWL